MIHTLLITLLIPLVMLFSISAKAVDSNERSLIKGGLLESIYEVPSSEVAPDIDHDALPLSQSASCELSSTKLISAVSFNTARIESSWFCRGPPQA